MESVNIDGDISGKVGYSNLWYEADFFSSFTSTCTFIISWQWGLKAGSGLCLLVPEHEVYARMVSVHICQLTVNYLCAHVVLKVSRKVNRCPDALLLFFIYLLSFLQMLVSFFKIHFGRVVWLWDVSFLTRDRTRAPFIGNVESKLLDQRSPTISETFDLPQWEQRKCEKLTILREKEMATHSIIRAWRLP